MRQLLRSILRSAAIGAVLGLPILGVGGRGLMRVIAHWEGRVPVLTLGGTVTVIFFGTLAGISAGVVYALLRKFVRQSGVVNVLFAVISVALTWRAVNELLPRPRLMFVALTLLFTFALEMILGRHPAAWTQRETA